MARMTKSDFEDFFKSEVLPHIAQRYERDGIPDRPARREAWNDAVDAFIQDRMLPESAGNWSHPRWLETWGRVERNPGRKLHRGRRKTRRNPSGAREPYESESGSALLRHFKRLKAQGVFGQSYGESGSNDGAHSLCSIYNDATAPNLYRTAADSKECKRVAMLCRRVRANHYGSRITETSNGAWQCRR